MAVRIFNEMPDVEVVRPPVASPIALTPVVAHSVRAHAHGGKRALFVIGTIALHGLALAAFFSAQQVHRALTAPEPMMAEILEAPAATPEAPPDYAPPPIDVVYSLEVPQVLSFETESITIPEPDEKPQVAAAQSYVPPIVESIEYVRSSPPVFPKESQRRREYGTVVLLVLVDTLGRPVQVNVERSSGFPRLDAAARTAVAKFLFRPYEVNGIVQPAQVRIPIGFDPPRSS